MPNVHFICCFIDLPTLYTSVIFPFCCRRRRPWSCAPHVLAAHEKQNVILPVGRIFGEQRVDQIRVDRWAVIHMGKWGRVKETSKMSRDINTAKRQPGLGGTRQKVLHFHSKWIVGKNGRMKPGIRKPAVKPAAKNPASCDYHRLQYHAILSTEIKFRNGSEYWNLKPSSCTRAFERWWPPIWIGVGTANSLRTFVLSAMAGDDKRRNCSGGKFHKEEYFIAQCLIWHLFTACQLRLRVWPFKRSMKLGFYTDRQNAAAAGDNTNEECQVSFRNSKPYRFKL